MRWDGNGMNMTYSRESRKRVLPASPLLDAALSVRRWWQLDRVDMVEFCNGAVLLYVHNGGSCNACAIKAEHHITVHS
jgi:hypothetical protein